MTINILLPSENGFFIDVDEENVHIKVEDYRNTFLFKKGAHTVCLQKQYKPGFFSKLILKILSLFTLEPYIDGEISDRKISFDLLLDSEITLDIKYKDCADIEIILDEEFKAYTKNFLEERT